MKNKIKVEFNKKEISDEEINSYKDFDKLLQEKDLILKNKPFHYSSLWITSFLVVSGIALMFFLAWETPKQNISEAIEEPLNEIILLNKDDKIDQTSPVQDSTVIHELKNEEEVKITASAESNQNDKNTDNNVLKDDQQYQDTEKTQQRKQKLSYNEPQKNDIANNEFVDAYPKEGFNALYDYFETELKYPEKAVQEKISGTVLVEFTISQTGAIEKIKVVKTLSPEIDQEAIRLISGMPAWMPATFGAETFSSKQTLPLTFQIK